MVNFIAFFRGFTQAIFVTRFVRLPELEMEMSKRSRNVISCNISSQFVSNIPFCLSKQYCNCSIESTIIKAGGKISEQFLNIEQH